jgi:hypothetical protein
MNHLNPVTTFHTHFRALRRAGKTKVEALTQAKQNHPDDYRAYCRKQEDGVVLQSLEEPNLPRVLAVLNSGGRLA